MADVNVVDTPVVNQQVPAQPQVPVVAAPEPDLLTKVSQFKPQVVASEIKNAPEQPEFEKITDPIAREAAKQAVERMRRDIQSSADRRVEESKRLIEQSRNWTPERIQQELLNNPAFVLAAQQVAATQNPPNSGLTDEQFSVLTDKEKAEVTSLRSEINQLKQNNVQTTLRAEIAQKDVQLQTRYADYDTNRINQAYENLANMGVADVREHIYKATFHDDHVKAAYEMGKADANGLNKDKINALSPGNGSVNNTTDVPTKNEGESNQAFFVRIAQYRLAEHKRK